jgi:hypothetical protein
MMRVALAQFFLFGFVLSLNDQTNSIIKPTTGINEINTEITQSLRLITGAVSPCI